MSRRRDPLTKDLFTWEPPKVAVGYSADVIGRGRLDAKIARLISHALRDAREEQGLSREAVAQQISDFLGRKVSPTCSTNGPPKALRISHSARCLHCTGPRHPGEGTPRLRAR